jgi:type II secretory pathway component PulK
MNNKGVALIMVLWVLLVLSLIAWGLGRRSAMEASLLETYRGKVRSYAAARAGINELLDLLQKSSSPKDTLYSTGIVLESSKSPVDVYSHMDIGQNAYVSVQWPAAGFNIGGGEPHLEYGLRDEGGRININTIGTNNYQVLSALLQLKGLSQADGDKLATAIVNYTGINAAASNNNSFMNLDHSALAPKNRHYENVMELLEVEGMTKEIFDQIKDDVTVYGDFQRGFWINTDTANNDVIQAVANAASRVNPSINAADIISQAYAIRDGADNLSFTPDDGAGAIAGVNNPYWPAALQEGISSYYRARVVGVDGDSGARTVLEAVIHHLPGTAGEITSWQRD